MMEVVIDGKQILSASLFFVKNNIKKFENVIRMSGPTFLNSTVDKVSIKSVCLLWKPFAKINLKKTRDNVFAGYATSSL